MARQALSPTCLRLVQALETHIAPALGEQFSTCRIGLSGGADSLALTAAAAWARDHRVGPLAHVTFTARIIDHGLQDGSDEVARVAARNSEELGIAAEVVKVSCQLAGQGVEAAAREARYAALNQGEDALILLAHTRDDQAETVLLGLARGSGTRSLAGMPRRRGQLLRPFLDVRRADTQQACEDWGLSWWEDPTNQDLGFARSRVRQALPGLSEALGEGLVDSLARTAEICREDADYLDGEASKVDLGVDANAIRLEVLEGLHPAIRARVLLGWLRRIGNDAVTKEHVVAVDSLITSWHGQKSISVPAGRVVRQSHELILSSDQD